MSFQSPPCLHLEPQNPSLIIIHTVCITQRRGGAGDGCQPLPASVAPAAAQGGHSHLPRTLVIEADGRGALGTEHLLWKETAERQGPSEGPLV